MINSGYILTFHDVNIDDSSKIATIFQSLLSTIWLTTTISLLFLTFYTQKEELEKTSASFRQQNEDNHFFSLMNTLFNIRDRIEISIPEESYNSDSAFPQTTEKKITGNKYFQYVYLWFTMFSKILDNQELDEKLAHEYKTTLNEIFHLSENIYAGSFHQVVFERREDFYSACFQLYYPLISDESMNYFNFLKQLLKYSQNCVNKTSFNQYIKSVLSPDEISLLFYFGLYDDEFGLVLREMNFFKDFSLDYLIEKKHIEFYRLNE
ncbi:hypothetical protein LPTSP3_g31740 [Leptospira kobayashii]|uniref:Phage abortive infection protein n=2 Tax=Leptospira kobayashii TaxID=1917830 RepID=A0ABM7UMC4_9LEPT|nr:hypothetical protein LPTSP3_g31740 [Leptospira kobayashii]